MTKRQRRLHAVKDEVAGLAENVTRAADLAADVDDDELNRRIHRIRNAVFQAGNRVVELEHEETR